MKQRANQMSQSQQPDNRRNSAIITAMVEKVAAVNQLVAEQQCYGTSGSKSLNSSPIPKSMQLQSTGIPGSTVVVQKPIPVLAPSSSERSGTLTRRCVTVCEDPVKAIHLQQQHQQLRSQLAAAAQHHHQSTMKTKHASLSECTSSILKQNNKASSASLRSTTPITIQQLSYSNSSEPIGMLIEMFE